VPKLSLDVVGDSKDAARALESAAKNVDELRRSADRLQHEFNEAERAAAGLDRELLKTKAATAALAAEFARTGDKGIKKELDAQRAAARGLERLRKDIIGDTERDAQLASKAWQKAADQLQRDTERVTRDRDRDSRLAERAAAAAASIAAKAGAEGAKTFASAFEGGLMNALKALPAPAQAGIAASIGAAVVLATPVIASAINAAVITGVGAGGLAAGIAIAAQDPGVKASFAELGTEAMKGLTDAASPFKDELHRVAQIFGDGFRDILPDLKGIFGDLSTTVKPLADGLVGMAREALPGIRRAAAAAVPLIESIADELPDMGRAMGSFFDSIAEGGPGAIAFMDVFLDQVEAGIVGLGAWLGEMGKVLGGAAILADAMGLVDFDPSAVAAKLGPVGDAATDVGTAFHEAKREITTFATELDKAFGVSMDQVEANLRLKESLANFKETLKENKGHWDDNTAAGRENIRALKDSIQAAYDKMQADIAAGTSASAARAEFDATKNSLFEQARAAGASDRALGLLKGTWESFLKTPGTKDLTIRVHQIGSVSAQGVVSGGDPRRNAGRAYASGGRYEAGVPRKVGENGWEIDVPDHGGYVINHADAMRMMNSSRSPVAAGFAGGQTYQTLPLPPMSVLEQALAAVILKLVRTGKLPLAA
jgi:hypothetical protein